MYSKATATTLLTCLSVGGLFQGVVAQVGKPFWSDNGLSLLNDFYEHQDGLGYNYVGIVPPQECLDRTNKRCSADQVEAQLVTYSDDCAEPWLLCRCNDANIDMQTLAYRFSTIPPGVRSYVGAAIAFREDSPHALFQSGYLEFYGDTSHAVFMHEATHALDFNVASSGQPVSGTDGWNQALNSDSCVTDYYGNTNPTEEFAQVGVVARYQLARGGLPKDASCLSNQLEFFKNGDGGRLWDALTRPKCHPPNRPFQLF